MAYAMTRAQITQGLDVLAESSSFRADQIAGCLFWGREIFGYDGSNRVTEWVNQARGGTDQIVGPATDSQKPTLITDPTSYPSARMVLANQQHMFGTWGGLFSGDDTPVTFVYIFRPQSTALNQVWYSLSSTTLAFPRHDGVSTTGFVVNSARRDNAGALITTSTGAPLANATPAMIVDIFWRNTANVGRRTILVNGNTTAVNDSAYNVGVVTFDRVLFGGLYLGAATPTFTATADALEGAVYNRRITLAEAAAYYTYAKARYPGLP